MLKLMHCKIKNIENIDEINAHRNETNAYMNEINAYMNC